MPVPQTYHVSSDLAGETLSALLRIWLPGTSWGEARQLVKGRRVMVNGNLCLDAARRLKTDEVVKVLDAPTARPPKDDDVEIRFLDSQLVVVEKPSGVTSVRHAEEQRWPERRKQFQPTLEEIVPRVLAKRKGIKSRRGGFTPVRPVHRLDRETSGLIVFARTVPAERSLIHQFREHTVHRRYLAIVQGSVEARTVETHLVRDRGDGRRGSTTQPGVGKKAVTHVRPVEQLEGYTLIECRLETGRTHQIRIHLAELGHPVCGEKIYHQPRFGTPKADRSGAPRLALHAAELGFRHPESGEFLKFKMALPRDLAELLARLRRNGKSPSFNRDP
jgi:23S rRNA pseudouridine1911/1915/1917 synthase